VEQIQHLVPAFDGGDDFVGVGGPDEGLGHLVGLLDEAVDGGLKVDDGAEDAALSRRLESLAKKPSTALSQEQEVWQEVEGEAGVAVEPLATPSDACGQRSCRG
jgi:hypothetical protein